MPIISEPWEAEARGLQIQGQLAQLRETLSQKKTNKKTSWLRDVAQLQGAYLACLRPNTIIKILKRNIYTHTIFAHVKTHQPKPFKDVQLIVC